MIWEVGKEYRTRDGRRARIYATDAGDVFPIHGAVESEGGWGLRAWGADGKMGIMLDHPDDIIPPRPPVVVSDAVLDAFLSASPDREIMRGSGWVRSFSVGLAAAIAAYLAEQDAELSR
jgi:hypothetical protein